MVEVVNAATDGCIEPCTVLLRFILHPFLLGAVVARVGQVILTLEHFMNTFGFGELFRPSETT